MRILIIYATNSGSTYVVSQVLEQQLRTKHAVTMQRVETTAPDDVAKADVILLGSPSWNYEGKEGSPHLAFVPFMNQMRSAQLAGKRFAVFGCGDTSYTYFCGAVDHLEKFAKSVNGTLLCPSLRIDGYFFDERANQARVEAWASIILHAV